MSMPPRPAHQHRAVRRALPRGVAANELVPHDVGRQLPAHRSDCDAGAQQPYALGGQSSVTRCTQIEPICDHVSASKANSATAQVGR